MMAPTRMSLRPRRRDNAVDDVPSGEVVPPQDGGRRSSEGGRSSRRRAKAPSPPASSTAAAAARAVMAAQDASPDSKCPICLDRFNNLAYLDRCLHRFCFLCIQEWSNNKAECPLCKQPFTTILHSVRAEDDFKEYTPRPAPTPSSIAATVAMVAAITRRQQVRLTVRRRRAGAESGVRRRRRERTGRGRAHRRAGMWRMYLEAPPPPAPPPATGSSHEESLEERIRIVTELAERSAVIDGFAGLWLPGASVTPDDRTSRRIMARLAVRLRIQQEGGTVRPLRDREMVALRRTLYRFGIRVRGVAGAVDTPGLQQPNLSAATFRQDAIFLNRLRPWLRRELTVLYGTHDSLVDVVQRIILARITYYGLETPIVADELRPFLLTRTEHFLHELVSFARSPLSMDNYDQQAVYEPPPEPDWVDHSSISSSSIISISEEEEEEEEFTPEEEEPAVTLSKRFADDVVPSSLSLSGWDDETPGPSYSTAEPSCSHALSPASLQPTNQEPAGHTEEEECLIVGYKKPIAERTPELVQLSSDSEEDQPPPTAEALPTIPPSTSGVFTEQSDGRSSHTRPWSACTLSPEEEQYHSRRKRRRRRRRERKSTLCLSSSESEAPPTPTDSLWRGRSPYLSSFSSSSSPFLRLSPVTPPIMPPLAPPTSSGGDALRGEKPGGKRKYKSRHLNSSDRERQRQERRERRPHPQREQRSPSVEIIYEGTSHKHKHRRKRQRRKESSSSPVIITLDSDSNHDNSISPLQPISDFSDLPPLPLVHPTSVGGALSTGVCDLPMEILDGCDGWTELTGSERTIFGLIRDQPVKGPTRTVRSDVVGRDSSLEDINSEPEVCPMVQTVQSAPRPEEVTQGGGFEPAKSGLSPKHTSCWSEDNLPRPDHAPWDTALPVSSSTGDHMTHLDPNPFLPHTGSVQTIDAEPHPPSVSCNHTPFHSDNTFL